MVQVESDTHPTFSRRAQAGTRSTDPQSVSAYRAQWGREARQDAGQYLGDIAQEEGAQRALVMLRIAAADGQDALLIIQSDHSGGTDFLAGFFVEEKRQLVGA